VEVELVVEIVSGSDGFVKWVLVGMEEICDDEDEDNDDEEKDDEKDDDDEEVDEAFESEDGKAGTEEIVVIGKDEYDDKEVIEDANDGITLWDTLVPDVGTAAKDDLFASNPSIEDDWANTGTLEVLAIDNVFENEELPSVDDVEIGLEFTLDSLLVEDITGVEPIAVEALKLEEDEAVTWESPMTGRRDCKLACNEESIKGAEVVGANEFEVVAATGCVKWEKLVEFVICEDEEEEVVVVFCGWDWDEKREFVDG
jgi:hypothetical protein